MLRMLTTLFLFVTTANMWAADVQIGHRRFTIPDGYRLELAAEPPLSKRPICVDFDPEGRLYVAESSGSNDNVQKQLKEKPHSILRLEDADNDGRFDQRTVFADRMMFPEGALWHDGSLYVAAPPSIWKLTDTNHDGQADQREEWFQGKTLTGCANDLHGPFVGPDGWIYWCKGAFAEQTYQQPGKEPLVTQAAHIFRRRPEGGPVEPVMTGGMDNPVEVAFTAGGERIFTTTFFQHPAGGQRDGLVHAIYGGVYGKRHGVIDGHARTGDLMPVLTHLGAAAPSGLARLKSTSLDYQHNLVTACFNLHKVIRHELIAKGATFESKNHDLVVCDDLDFHPTDVIEDADGSLLIVDTGGWYKLCCPTSQLKKPDIYGAIYRLSRKGATASQDPRGRRVDWKGATLSRLMTLLEDPRPIMSQRAMQELASRGKAAIPSLSNALATSDRADVRTNAVWTLCRIAEPEARAAIRTALGDAHTQVRQAAGHAVSVWRDKLATLQLGNLLTSGSPHNRRVAAEALGRIGDSSAVSHLIAAIDAKNDRVLNHSLIYALIEIGDVENTRLALASSSSSVRRAGLIAIDQMKKNGLTPNDVCPLLVSADPVLREAATFVAEKHPEWGAEIVGAMKGHLSPTMDAEERFAVKQQLSRLCHNREAQEFLADLLEDDSPVATKILALEILRERNVESDLWAGRLSRLLQSQEQKLIASVVRLLGSQENAGKHDSPTAKQLAAIAQSPQFNDEVRLMAMNGIPDLDSQLFSFVLRKLSSDQPVAQRSLAANLIAESKPTKTQFDGLVEVLPMVGPMELSKVLRVFAMQKDQALGRRLIESLATCPSTASLPQQLVEALAANFGPAVSESARSLYASAATSLEEKTQALEHYLATLPVGDIRRGQRVFHGEKTACFACHGMGYRGGQVGPDLTRIARIRSRRDLLEAILYPSNSFVRSYEPVIVLTTSGESVSGTVRDRTDEYTLMQISATEQRRIDAQEIDEILPGRVSVMPAGLEKQLSEQQLADLLAFLESRK